MVLRCHRLPISSHIDLAQVVGFLILTSISGPILLSILPGILVVVWSNILAVRRI